MASEREYLEKAGVEKAFADAIVTVLAERPDNVMGRIAQILSPAPMAAETYLSTVGKTPMVKLNRILPDGCKANVYAKMEMQNPGGSIKDRIALNMIEEAEASGALKPGMTIVEATSGNTGIGVSMVAAAKGYKCIIIMPRVPPMLERYMIARQFGADVHLTCAGKGAIGMLTYYETLVSSDPAKYFGTDQFKNPKNPLTHLKTTGPEIWAQTAGKIDIFIHGIGTGGTISGAGKFLKEKKPSVQVVAIEPSNSRVHVGGPVAPHTVVGIGAGIVTNFFGLEGKVLPEPTPIPGVIDEWAHASGDEAVEWATKAACTEGMMIGPSAGAALKIAVDVALRPESAGKTIVVVFASHGIRYTAHPLWAKVKKEAVAALPAPPDMNKELDLLQWTSEGYVPEPPPEAK